jgi:hypothetical protein
MTELIQRLGHASRVVCKAAADQAPLLAVSQ